MDYQQFLNLQDRQRNESKDYIQKMITEYDLESKAFKKTVNLGLSEKVKQDIIKEYGFEKNLNLSGFQKAQLNVNTYDGDSGTLRDYQTGEELDFRIADINPIDVIDKEKGRTQSVYKSKIQPSVVSNLTGKPIENLTENDYTNVANYQQQQIYASLSIKDHEIQPYDKNSLYEKTDQPNITVAYRVTGKDKYNRALVELINPETGRQVSFDVSNNVYLNAAADIYNSIDTKANRDKLINYYTEHDNLLTTVADIRNTNYSSQTIDRLQENLDVIKSSAYSTAARLLQYGPEFLVEKQKWKTVANPVTGKALADAWAGVKVSTREDFQNKMFAASEAWENKDYLGAIIGWMSQMDRVLSESAVQMALIAAGTAATGGVFGAVGIGASIASRTAIAIIGAMPAGLDKTLMTIEDYKLNNDGRMMSEGELAEAFAINTITLIPETFLLGINFIRLLPKPLSKAFSPVYQSSKPISAGKAIGHSALFEGFQEGLETATENWLSQNQDDPQTLLSYLTSSETQQGAVIGTLMGMSMSGAGIGIKSAVTAPFSIGSKIRQANSLNSIRANQEKYNVLGEEADIDVSNSIQKSVQEMPTSYSTIKEVEQAIDNLNTLAATANVNTTTTDAIKIKQKEIIKEWLTSTEGTTVKQKNLKALAKATGQSTDELYREQVFYSDYNGSRQFIQSGRHLTEKGKEAAKEELLKTAEQLNITKKEAETIINQTINSPVDTTYGSVGISTYESNIKTLNKVLSDTTLDENTRTTLSTARDANIAQLIKLANSQNMNLKQFAEHAEKIKNKTVANSKFTFLSNKRNFIMYGSNLANNTYESGKGVYGEVQTAYKNVSRIKKVLNTLPTDVKDRLIENKGESFGLSIDTDVALQRFKDASTNIRNRILKERKEALSKKSNGVTPPISDRSVIAKLNTLSKPNVKQNTETNFKADIRSLSKSQIERVTEAIKDNKVLTDMLKSIVNLEETTNTETTEMEVRNNEAIEKATQKLEEFEKIDITKIDDIKELRKLQQEVQLNNSVIADFNTELSKKFTSISKQISDRINEILTEIAVKANETTKKTTQTNVVTKLEQADIITDIEGFDNQHQVIKERIETFDINAKDALEESEFLLGVIDETFNSILNTIPENMDLRNENSVLRNRLLTKRKPLLKANEFVHQDDRLSKELKISDNPKSIIGVTGAKAIHKKLIKSLMSPMLFFGTKLYKQDKFYYKSEKSNIPAILKENPHFALLYNITENTNGTLNFEVNEDVMAAIDLSFRQYFSENNINSMFDIKNYSIEILANMFGMKEEKLKDNTTTLNQIRDTINKHGLPRTFFTDRLGNLILENLGIEKDVDVDTNGTYNYYQRLTASLGLFAIQYGIELGTLTNSHANPIKSANMPTDVGMGVPYIKPNMVQMNKITDYYKDSLKKDYILENSIKNMPSNKPIRSKPNQKQRHTLGLMKIPTAVKKVMNNMRKVSFTVNTDLSLFVQNNRQAIMKRLGYIEDIENQELFRGTKESQEGINLSIERELDGLQDLTKEQIDTNNDKWYFDWFMSKNGRLFIDSNYINPQTNKSLQRFLILPSNMYRAFDPNNKKHIISENFAIAQAFDTVKTEENIQFIGEELSKFTKDQLETFRTDLIRLTEDNFIEKYKVNGVNGVENLGQALNVIQHLMTKQDANGKSFNTWLAVENDSTTSGYFIKMLQFVNESLLGKFGEKVGIFKKDKSNVEIHSKKALVGFNDIYQTAALEAVELLPDLDIHIVNGILKHFDELEDIDIKDKETLTILYTKLQNALPKADINEKGNKTVSSALRKLFKNPTMIFGYNARERTIKRKIASDITEDFINTYMDLKRKKEGLEDYLKTASPKEKAIYNTFEIINKNYKGNLHKDLQTKYLNEIYIEAFNSNLETLFENILMPTYGQAVWKSLSDSFSHFNEFNNNMVTMFNHMFKIFDKAHTKMLKTLENKFKNTDGVPLKEYNEALNKLFNKMPAIHLIYSENLDEGMLLMNSEKQRDKKYKVNSKYKGKDENGNYVDKSMTTAPDIRKFIDSGLAGAVLPIHFIDGMGIAMMMEMFPNSIPVHDALVMSAMDSGIQTQAYNETMFLLNKTYDVFSILTETFKQMMYDNVDLNSKIVIDNKQVTVQDYISNLDKLVAENKSQRDNFFNEDRYVSNMDGEQGSGTLIPAHRTLEENRFIKGMLEISKMKNVPIEFQSDPNTYRTNGDITQRLQDANESIEGRVGLFDDLQDLAKAFNNIVEDEEHVNYLKDLIRGMNNEHLLDIIVEYSNSQDFNVSVLTLDNVLKIGFDNKSLQLDSNTSLSAFSGKSPAEMYAHELVHAGLRVGLNNIRAFGLTNTVKQLFQLQLEAVNIVTWEDFMPSNYDVNLQSVYEQQAKTIWDYIFKNDGKFERENLQSLHEFIAHSLTNKKLMDKLKQYNVVASVPTQKVKLLDKIIALGKTILDVVFGDKQFGTEFSSVYEILKGNLPIRFKQNIFAEIETLTAKINSVNNKSSAKLYTHPLKAIEQMFKFVSWIVTKGNEFLSPILKFLTDYNRQREKLKLKKNPDKELKQNLPNWYSNLTNTLFDNVKALSYIIASYPFSSQSRRIMKEFFNNVLKFSQQGALQTIWRDVRGPDDQTAALQMIAALTRSLDTASKEIEAANYREIANEYDKGKNAFTNEESVALAKSILFTDLQSLFTIDEITNTTNIDDIMELLSNPAKVKIQINTIKKELRALGQRHWYYNQSFGLARFMTTGKGHELQNLNATNIAKGLLSNKQMISTPEIIAKIDRLTTLLALQMTDRNHIDVLHNMGKKGLTNFLRLHQKYVKESYEGVQILNNQGQKETVEILNDIHIIKGYSKQLYDTSIDIQYNTIANEQLMINEGYRLVGPLKDNKVTGQKDIGIYRKTFSPEMSRQGAGIVIVGAKAKGNELRTDSYRVADNNNFIKDEAKILKDIYNANANKISDKFRNIMFDRELTTDMIENFSEDYTPIINQHGEIVDYRITMSQTTKEKVLNINNNGAVIASKMFAEQNTKAYASVRNTAMLEFLISDMTNNMDLTTHINEYGDNYIKLEKDTENKFLQEAWKVVPKEFLDYIEHSDLFIRSDWLGDIFGIESFSLTETEFINKYANPNIKRGIAIGEYILKTIAWMSKQNYIIRMPVVLIGNIISNFNYNIMSNGASPTSVFKRTIDNAQAIRDYLDTKKEINRIMLRSRIKTATKSELNKLNILQTKLEQNLVHPLMEKGMYQSIIEDINPDELEAVGKVNQIIKNNKFIKKIPSPIKWITKQTYMAEGTPIYDLMFTATKYSDFVARAVEYQFKMEKAPEKWEVYTDNTGQKRKRITNAYAEYEFKVSKDVWNAFINYDKPQSKLEQYLNDIGLVYFTKFFKNIQHVITKNLIENPMGTLMFLIGQGLLKSNLSEHIMEQNIFNKYISGIVRHPAKELLNVLIPVPIQSITGFNAIFPRW